MAVSMDDFIRTVHVIFRNELEADILIENNTVTVKFFSGEVFILTTEKSGRDSSLRSE